jgi:hypothetical protein
VNTNLEQTKLAAMDIQDIRRRNLRTWLRDRSTPEKEKSYFSQLLSGASSFGERAARRIEKQYGMGDGYLDKDAPTVSVTDIEDLPPMFREAVRLAIDRYREIAAKIPPSVLQMLQRPTSENYVEWESAIEESYRRFASSSHEVGPVTDAITAKTRKEESEIEQRNQNRNVQKQRHKKSS